MDEDGELWVPYGDLMLHFYATPHLVVCEVGVVCGVGDVRPEPSAAAPQLGA
jgi:hypothetical protein